MAYSGGNLTLPFFFRKTDGVVVAVGGGSIIVGTMALLDEGAAGAITTGATADSVIEEEATGAMTVGESDCIVPGNILSAVNKN